MTILLFSVFFMLFFYSRFVGIFLFMLMFLYLFSSCYLFGVDYIKGDLFGILGSDYISFCMVLLLLWVISLVMILFFSWLLFFFSMLLMFSVMMMFYSMDFVYLFLNFEFSMIPMMMMILYMGAYKERYFAGMYMFIYTMVSSFPMIFVMLIFKIDESAYSINYNLYNLLFFDKFFQIFILMLFLVKVPMFVVHIWLPKAHVEAPVYGSMILASIMLKMGGYGVIRCMDFMEVDLFVDDFFFCLCLCGGVVISYYCMYQVDLKVLVAYSSIVHMGIMLMGFYSMTEVGYLGGIIMMLSHGICSSGMFYLVNEIYKVSGSRLLILNKGFISVMPMLVWLWLVMLINNLGVPPCFGILGELMLMMGCLSYSIYISFFFFVLVFFVSCFVVNMYVFLVGGLFMFRSVVLSVFIYYGSFMHLIPLNTFIFFIGICF